MESANSDVLSTPRAAALLGVSRQHMANLGDHGVIPCWRVGSHRRYRLEDLLGYKSGLERTWSPDTALGTLNLSDRRSYVFGLLVAAKLAADPDAVLARAEKNLRRLRRVHSDGSADALLDRWEELLSGPIEQVIAILSSSTPSSVELRHASPFAGVLTDEERAWVIRATRAAA
jgi:excisionase family DNA binding protein